MEQKLINKAIEKLKAGGLVIAPADTSYAILADAANPKAIVALDQIKGNRSDKPYSVFINDLAMIDFDRDRFDLDQLKILLSQHTTVILPVLNGSLAVRFSPTKIIKVLVAGISRPLTATSANPSGKEPARNQAMIKKYFHDNNCLIIYEGEIPKQPASTIIDLTGRAPKVIRQGKYLFQKTQFRGIIH